MVAVSRIPARGAVVAPTRPVPVSRLTRPAPFGSGLASAGALGSNVVVHPRARREFHSVVPANLRVADSAAAAVLRTARQKGPVVRDIIAKDTGLSIATVNRQVTALLELGLLRERADLAASGAIGRPRVPVEVHHEPYLTLGIHVGATTTSIVATDLLGRALDSVEIATPTGPQAATLESLAISAGRYLQRWHRRRPLWVGVAIGGTVNATTGTVSHARLGWSNAPIGQLFARSLNLPVSVSAHVEAMAAAELLLAPPRASERSAKAHTSLFVYARETVGLALVLDGRVHSPATGPGTISGLPVQSRLLLPGDGRGTLEAAVSDRSIVETAVRLGIIGENHRGASVSTLYQLSRDGSVAARELLGERARVLGESVALLRDIFNPDDVIVGGHAFTEYAPGVAQVVRAFEESTRLPRTELRVSGFGARVQEVAAGVVSLGAIYADPVGALRRLSIR